MRRTLLVAEGTFQRPLVEIATTAIALSVTLSLAVGVFRLGLPGWATALAIAALLIVAAVLKGRYGGPQEFRLERPAGGATLRLTGRFANGEIGAGSPRDVVAVERDGDALAFRVADTEAEAVYRLTRPAFSQASMSLLHDLVRELPALTEDDLAQRYASRRAPIRAYNARGLLLLRFSQKPAYMLLTWATAAATVVVWLLVLSLLAG